MALLGFLAVIVLLGCGADRSHAAGSGVPSALYREARPVGRGPSFRPPFTGPVIGTCRSELGPRVGVHVEVFAANRVVIVAEGIGTNPPRRFSEGRIFSARCYGELVTLEPTGVLLVRPGAKLSLAELFRSWGQPLSRRRVGSFSADPGA